jgi:hypothetical protein
MPLLSKSAGAAFCDAGERHIAYCQGLQLGKQRRVAPLHVVPAAGAKMCPIMRKTQPNPSSTQPIVLYTTQDGRVTVDVRFDKDNFWLTQKAMAELFGVKVPAVNKHLKNIYASGELVMDATISKMEIVQTEGERQVAREQEYYNLDAVIAVGYRINSVAATRFKLTCQKHRQRNHRQRNPHLRCDRGNQLVVTKRIFADHHAACAL